ncbi:MAG: hypothetical protein VKJ31_03280 [Synechococcus sp.]|nr:hypothetical protein [Synechococcus sp.]
MLRSAPLASQCLACQVPLAGPLSWPARFIGIGRNAENPNLCSRCGYHLSVGEIRPAQHLLLELGGELRFGSVSLQQLSERELPALVQQLRGRLEDQGALVLPAEADHPLQLSAYFNVPVELKQPALHAFKAVREVLQWLQDELTGLGLECGWRALLASGFVEVVACEEPLACYPIGEVSFRAKDALRGLAFGQFACDGASYAQLCEQDGLLMADVLGPQLTPVPEAHAVITLLQSGEEGESMGALGRARPQRFPQVSALSQFGALLLALIAAPCAAMVVMAPGAVVVGLGAAFGVLLPFWKAVGMSLWPRVLITLLAVAVASINLIRAELARKRFRDLQRQVGTQLRLPKAQLRRLRVLRWSSVFVLAMVLLEGVLRVFVMKMPLL